MELQQVWVSKWRIIRVWLSWRVILGSIVTVAFPVSLDKGLQCVLTNFRVCPTFYT
jgi:hypothetical protein